MTGFEPATTRPPDAYSNRTELHPVLGFSSRLSFLTFAPDFVCLRVQRYSIFLYRASISQEIFQKILFFIPRHPKTASEQLVRGILVFHFFRHYPFFYRRASTPCVFYHSKRKISKIFLSETQKPTHKDWKFIYISVFRLRFCHPNTLHKRNLHKKVPLSQYLFTTISFSGTKKPHSLKNQQVNLRFGCSRYFFDL